MFGKKSPDAGSKGAAKTESRESFRTIFWALVIAIVIRTFFVQAFRIPSGSMEDTLLIGDFLLVDKITFGARVPGTQFRLPGFREPRQGDIIVFKDPNTNRDFIKRCIAIGGETISIDDNEVFVNAEPLDEPYKYLKPVPFAGRTSMPPLRLAPGTLFMMGDNRNNSQDSRYWGPLDAHRVVGRAFVLYWSTDPDAAPRWVRDLPENWVKGFLQLFLGRPRFSRVGTWLAKDWSQVYAAGLETSAPASAGGASSE